MRARRQLAHPHSQFCLWSFSATEYRRLAVLCDLKQMPDDAIRAALEAERLAGSSPAIVAASQRAATQGGCEGIVRMRVDRLRRASGSSFAIATDYARLRDNEKAIHWLEEAYREHNIHLLFAAVHPYLSGLTTDRRLQDIERRIGFSEEQIERASNSGTSRGTNWEQSVPEQGGKPSNRVHVNQ